MCSVRVFRLLIVVIVSVFSFYAAANAGDPLGGTTDTPLTKEQKNQQCLDKCPESNYTEVQKSYSLDSAACRPKGGDINSMFVCDDRAAEASRTSLNDDEVKKCRLRCQNK